VDVTPIRRPSYGKQAAEESAAIAGICEYAGHDWAPMGGGLLLCMVCDEEKWATGEEFDDA
jgi:hypothetical protein